MRALIVAGFLLTCSAAGAQPSLTRDVVGVAGDDVLNVRAGPSANHPLVGALSPMATGVLIETERGDWTEIRSGKLQGWVSSRYLGQAEPLAPVSDGEWQCRGTEPFWSATIQGGKVMFEGDGTKFESSPISDEKRSANSPTTWSFRFAAGAVHGTLEGGTVCSDGMSDTVYRRTLHLDRAGRLLSGCCRRP